MSFVATQTLSANGEKTAKINASDSYAGEIVVHVRGDLVGTITVYGMVNPGVSDGDREVIDAENMAGGAKGTTITTQGIFRISAAGLHVQLEITAWTSGAADIDLVPSVG